MGTIKPVRAKTLKATSKGCFPEPIVMTGTFSTTTNAVSVTSITRSTTTATVTCATSHNRSTGDIVEITGAVQTEYNGFKKIIVTSATVFTFTVESTPASPATGTILAKIGGCMATGVGTLATTQLQKGSSVYVPALNQIRTVKAIYTNLKWEFGEDFSSNVSSGTLVRVVPYGMYKGIGAIAQSGTPVFNECTLAVTDPPINILSEDFCDPICWDATGGQLLINILRQ